MLTPHEDFYEQRHPSAADRLLVIEVSETTLRYDRQTKMPLEARHGVPELWIVDTAEKQLHVFRDPAGTSYGEALTFDQPGLMRIGALPGVAVDMAFGAKFRALVAAISLAHLTSASPTEIVMQRFYLRAAEPPWPPAQLRAVSQTPKARA